MKKLFILFFLVGFNLPTREITPAFKKQLKETKTPKVFFKGSVSHDSTVQWNNSFTDDGKQIVYTIAPKGKPSYIVTQHWEKEGYAQYTRILKDTLFPYSDPHFSPKGDCLLVSTARSFFKGDTALRNFHLWKSIKKDNKWEAPKRIEWKGFDNGCFYPTLTQDNHVYFSYNEEDGERNSNLYRAIWNGNSYEQPKPLSINTEKFEGDPFIDRKERFLIFAAFDREENYGKSDLYISFKKGDS